MTSTFGVRGDSKIFLEFQKRFYDDIFFPTLEREGIDTVLDLGDTFDRRKYINFSTLGDVKEFYFDRLRDMNITLHTIVGNHSIYYRNTNALNSMSLLLKEYENIKVYHEEPVELTFDNTPILMVPWITPENHKVTMDTLRNTKSQIVMGHFEILGFEMMQNQICEHGVDRKIFNKFDLVYSGHFHYPSTLGNISYLGAPYEMTWSDYGSRRGFHIFDTSTRELTHIPNTFNIFHKIYYDDSKLTLDDVANLDVSGLTNTYLKIIVQNKDNPFMFDVFLDKIQDGAPFDVKVIEDYMGLDEIEETDLVDEALDTRDILKQYVTGMETKVSKHDLTSIIDGLYTEAINLK